MNNYHSRIRHPRENLESSSSSWLHCSFLVRLLHSFMIPVPLKKRILTLKFRINKMIHVHTCILIECFCSIYGSAVFEAYRNVTSWVHFLAIFGFLLICHIGYEYFRMPRGFFKNRIRSTLSQKHNLISPQFINFI